MSNGRCNFCTALHPRTYPGGRSLLGSEGWVGVVQPPGRAQYVFAASTGENVQGQDAHSTHFQYEHCLQVSIGPTTQTSVCADRLRLNTRTHSRTCCNQQTGLALTHTQSPYFIPMPHPESSHLHPILRCLEECGFMFRGIGALVRINIPGCTCAHANVHIHIYTHTHNSESDLDTAQLIRRSSHA